jgi:hypothetical protein
VAESRACAERTSGYDVTSGDVTSGSTTSHHLRKCGFVRAHILLTLANIGYPVERTKFDIYVFVSLNIAIS